MISNNEFIKTHSFEIAWAVFRCAELFDKGQQKLRSELESAAVDLLSKYDSIDESMREEAPHIEKLVSIIRLAETIGQIKSVNAQVLYRELGRLEAAIKNEIEYRHNRNDITGALEDIFSQTNRHPLLNQRPAEQSFAESNHAFVQPVQQVSQFGSNNGIADTMQKFVKVDEQKFGSIESLLSAALPNNQIGREASVVQPSAPALSAVAQDSAITKVPASSAEYSAASSVPGSWQHVILQKVKERKQTTTKELTANFPEISERTIRFYLQKLVEGGLIDRVGTTGPGAYYKAKN